MFWVGRKGGFLAGCGDLLKSDFVGFWVRVVLWGKERWRIESVCVVRRILWVKKSREGLPKKWTKEDARKSLPAKP